MAEESSNNQVESEKVESEDGDEKAYHPIIERITITKGPPKISSRYLGGAKGSCHDMCKYGIQHDKKAKKIVVTREGKTKLQEENAAATSLAGTKKSGRKTKPSQTPKVGDLNSVVDIKEVIDEKTFNSEKSKRSPPFEETHVSMEHNDTDLRQARSEQSPLPVQESPKSQSKREKSKNKSAFGSSSIKQTRLPVPTSSSPLSSTHKGKKPSSLSSAKTSKNLKIVSPLKDHGKNVEEAKPELASNDSTPDKVLHVVEPASTNASEEPALPSAKSRLSSPSPSTSGGKMSKQARKKINNSGVSASSRKGLRHVTRPSASASISPLFSGSKGKTPRSVSRPTSISSVSSSIISRGKHSVASTSRSNRTRIGDQGENVKVGYKIKPRMSTIVGGASKVIPARKLTFRRGKVIEIQPQNHNIPRRLKFRSVRRLGDDIHRDITGARKRTTANKEVDCGGSESSAANAKSRFQAVEGGRRRSPVGRKVGGDRSKIGGPKSGSDEKVVLRHQDVEEKKANPRLYNNVIEETASMLAELRKSKVKALVGAFETVISLDSPREATREATPSEVSIPC